MVFSWINNNASTKYEVLQKGSEICRVYFLFFFYTFYLH